MKRPTLDIEYLWDTYADYGTSSRLSDAIEHVIKYIEDLEKRLYHYNDFELDEEVNED